MKRSEAWGVAVVAAVIIAGTAATPVVLGGDAAVGAGLAALHLGYLVLFLAVGYGLATRAYARRLVR